MASSPLVLLLLCGCGIGNKLSFKSKSFIFFWLGEGHPLSFRTDQLA